MADYLLTDADRETLKAFRRGAGAYMLIPGNPLRIIQPNPLYRTPSSLRSGIPSSFAEAFILSLDPNLTEEERLTHRGAWARRIGGAE